MNSWTRRTLGALLIGVFLPVSSAGCFGRFELTRKVYSWNTNLDQDKWVRWFAFLLLILIPYPLALTIDTLLGNSVEFWTGDNPITAGEPRVIRGENGEVVTLERRGEDVLDVTVQTADDVSSFVFVREGRGLSAWDTEGRLLARVMDVNGEPMVVAGSFAQ
jgi:hypothetical protein